MATIEVRQLRRRYRIRSGPRWRRRQEIDAVRSVSFDIAPGELFGLLGPNGAGKTTIIKIITTVLLPSEGSVRVHGFDVVEQPMEVRRRIGYVFGGDRGLYNRLSAYDNLRYFAELYAVPARAQRRRIGQLLELVGLNGRESEKVEGFSRGMRQRLHIARGLLHDPPVVLLDEPSIGIDPVGARQLRALVAGLAESGKTVLLTTHYMYEADELCDRIAVLRDGAIVALDTPAGLKSMVSREQLLEVVVYGVEPEAVARIGRLAGVTSVAVEDRGHAQLLRVRVAEAADVARAALACLDGVRVGSVTTREPTLEDAYVELVGAS